MGLQREYIESGGFSAYLYTQVGSSIVTSNGLVGKVVEKIEGTSYDGLPTFSNTSDIYLKKNENGKIIQARIYKDRKPLKDFDWDHGHKNKKTKEKFPEGIVHVQEWHRNADGKWMRDKYKARYMTPQEIAEYGELIKLANPDAILTP